MALVTLREATLEPIDPAAYRLQLFGLMASAGDITGGADTAMVKLLDDARAEIQNTLGALALDSPSRQLYERALRGVETATANLADRMNKTIADYQAQGLALGVDLATKPVGGERGFDVVSNAITGEQLRILSGYSASLVQDITTTLRSKINGEIASIVIGAKSPYAASVAIGKNLTDPNHFRSIAHRARAIVVTEVGRAQALGTQVGQQALQATLKAGGFTDVVLKRWINAHLPGARQTHLEAEARYAPDGAVGPIPVGDLYEIGGFKALYPRDPSLPAGESVHCHCFSVTVFAEGPDPLAGNTKVQLQGEYTGALNTASVPAEKLTKKHLNGASTIKFVKDPYASVERDSYGNLSAQGIADTFYPGYTGPPGPHIRENGWRITADEGRWRHPAAPKGRQTPDFDQLEPFEQKALMDAAGLNPGQQKAVLQHYASKATTPPATYTTSKAITPPDNVIAKPAPASPPPPTVTTPDITPEAALADAYTNGIPIPPSINREALKEALEAHDAELKAAFEKWAATTATEQQIDAINHITGDDYLEINQFLRQQIKELPDKSRNLLPHLETAIDSFPDTGWQVTWRKAATNTYEEGDAIRDRFRRAAESGDTWRPQGYFSTTTRAEDIPDARSGYNILYEVYSKKSGAWAAEISQHYDEREWLIKHGAEFEVLGVENVTYGKSTYEVVRLRER